MGGRGEGVSKKLYNLTMIPKSLQGILWSVNTDKIDILKDKIYIIHQILAYGTLDQIKWLFSTYDAATINETFINNHTKNYVPASFNFVKNILLKIPGDLNPKDYVRSFPRHLRS